MENSLIDRQLKETADKLAQVMKLKEEAEPFAKAAAAFNDNVKALEKMVDEGRLSLNLSEETRAELSGKMSAVMQAAFEKAVMECKAAGEEMAAKIRETGEGMVRELAKVGDDICKRTIERQRQLERRDDVMTIVWKGVAAAIGVSGFLFGIWAASVTARHVGPVLLWIFIGSLLSAVAAFIASYILTRRQRD